MRTRIFFFILLVVALLGIVGWYVLYGKIVGQASAASQARAAQQASQESRQQDQSLASFLSTSSSTAMALLSSVVPQNGSVSFISMIENIAKQAHAGVRIQDVKISSPSKVAPGASTSKFDALVLDLSFQGSWSEIYSFINMLETLPYKVRLNNISLSQSVFSVPSSGSASASTQSFWTGTLTLSVLKTLAPGDLSSN